MLGNRCTYSFTVCAVSFSRIICWGHFLFHHGTPDVDWLGVALLEEVTLILALVGMAMSLIRFIGV